MTRFSGQPAQQPLANTPSSFSSSSLARGREADSLADVLDRVLDKGVVIAGDIRISLLDIELLTIKLRLLIASADKAKELGIDWWSRDPELSSAAQDLRKIDGEKENNALRRRVEQLESRLNSLLNDERQAPRRGAARGNA
jgi:hypothetical protein